jgi:deoxyribonuclease IV
MWADCVKGIAEKGHPIGACLDTAHLWGAGWDLQPDNVTLLVDAIEGSGILPYLRVIHLNDSSAEAGSRRDRHEHIGDGIIPLRVFKSLLTEPRLAAVAGIVETDPAEEGVARDVQTLKRLRSPEGQA